MRPGSSRGGISRVDSLETDLGGRKSEEFQSQSFLRPTQCSACTSGTVLPGLACTQSQCRFCQSADLEVDTAATGSAAHVPQCQPRLHSCQHCCGCAIRHARHAHQANCHQNCPRSPHMPPRMATWLVLTLKTGSVTPLIPKWTRLSQVSAGSGPQCQLRYHGCERCAFLSPWQSVLHVHSCMWKKLLTSAATPCRASQRFRLCKLAI